MQKSASWTVAHMATLGERKVALLRAGPNMMEQGRRNIAETKSSPSNSPYLVFTCGQTVRQVPPRPVLRENPTAPRPKDKSRSIRQPCWIVETR